MNHEKKAKIATCASCQVEKSDRACSIESGKGGKGCPTLIDEALLTEANQEYQDAQILEFARQASIQEAECYAHRGPVPYTMQPTKTRILEIIEFAQKMKYTRLGLAFCMGLTYEAQIVEQILKDHGFDVFSVICKAGCTGKDFLNLSPEERINQGTDESMCNPIFQAKVLDRQGTQLNILVGLCVGHDSLFIKYSQAPVTVLAVKDRVTGHNPMAAIYTAGSYYKKLHDPELT